MKKSLLFSLFILLSAGLVLSACSKDDDDDGGGGDDPNLTDLEKAKKSYQDNYIGTKLNTIGWTGNEASCNSGDVSSDTRKKVVKRVNYYRALCGLPATVTLNSSQNKSCQDAALIMMANNTLTHTPSSGMKCWTQAGYDAAKTGNIAIGWGSAEPDANHSINAVSGFIEDHGGGNEIVGHRAWLLHPALSAIGTGSVYDANHTYQNMQGAAANCIRWGNNLNGDPNSGPEFIAYPPAAYIPSVLVFPRWSFAIANADFSSAKVTVKSGSTTYPCNIIARVPQNGSNPAARLVWEPSGISITQDMDFSVTVSDIKNISMTSYTYTVKAFYVPGVARKATEKRKMLIL